MPSRVVPVLTWTVTLAVGVVWGAAPRFWRPDNIVLDVLVHVGHPLVALGIIGIGSLVDRRRWPASLVVRDTAFVVPSRPLTVLVPAGVLLLTASSGARTFLDWQELPAWMLALSIFLAATAVALAVVVIWRQPRLELKADGIWHHDRLGTAAIPWQAMRPGRPWRPRPGERLTLTIDRPELVRVHGLKRNASPIAVDLLRIHPWFLADVIRFYATFPEHQPAIGADAEYHRLRHLLMTGRAPAQF